ncbi:hypothetical protein KC360_g40 [Hortaea werneckii]|nr:hypothetical protein KC344_g38 [Hortaea werneckii]KAI7180381.1 hypothetical protein KC360_g40 [Hortaea werneckii]
MMDVLRRLHPTLSATTRSRPASQSRPDTHARSWNKRTPAGARTVKWRLLRPARKTTSARLVPDHVLEQAVRGLVMPVLQAALLRERDPSELFVPVLLIEDGPQSILAMQLHQVLLIQGSIQHLDRRVGEATLEWPSEASELSPAHVLLLGSRRRRYRVVGSLPFLEPLNGFFGVGALARRFNVDFPVARAAVVDLDFFVGGSSSSESSLLRFVPLTSLCFGSVVRYPSLTASSCLSFSLASHFAVRRGMPLPVNVAKWFLASLMPSRACLLVGVLTSAELGADLGGSATGFGTIAGAGICEGTMADALARLTLLL